MTCGHCVQSVSVALEAIAGVDRVSVQLEENKAHISYDAQKVDLPNIKKAVEDAGYALTGTE